MRSLRFFFLTVVTTCERSHLENHVAMRPQQRLFALSSRAASQRCVVRHCGRCVLAAFDQWFVWLFFKFAVCELGL